MAVQHPLPTEEVVLSYFRTHSNWGRWGSEDNAGTINLITPQRRRDAAALVRSGRAVSLAHPLNTVGGPGNPNPAQHYLRVSESTAVDYIGVSYHGIVTTHIDALCHIFWKGTMYNGKPASRVTSLGAESNAVDAWSSGITTRGVLVDIPRLRGTAHVSIEEPIRGWEIESAVAAQGTELRPGDAVIVFGGQASYAAAGGAAASSTARPGLHADVIPVLHRHDSALLGWDMMDARPTGYAAFDQGSGFGLPIHALAIVYLGLPLIDNMRLEPLAEACRDEGRWEFMLTVNPLHVRGGTGSPVNPIAIF